MDLGDRVLYRLDAADAEKISAWRANFAHFNAGMSGHKHPHRPGSPGATGHVAHTGVPVSEGDVLFADVCAVPDPESGRLNLRVGLNGNDVLHVTGVPEGTGPGTWQRRDPRPASMLRPVTFAIDDDEAELRRVPMRPITEAEEAEDRW